jgi:predicted amidohydrolase
MFTTLMQVRALENQFWVAAVNKGGQEEIAGKEMLFYGRSCIVHPSGKIIAQGHSSKPATICATIDLKAVTMREKCCLCGNIGDRKSKCYKGGMRKQVQC